MDDFDSIFVTFYCFNPCLVRDSYILIGIFLCFLAKAYPCSLGRSHLGGDHAKQYCKKTVRVQGLNIHGLLVHSCSNQLSLGERGYSAMVNFSLKFPVKHKCGRSNYCTQMISIVLLLLLLFGLPEPQPPLSVI